MSLITDVIAGTRPNFIKVASLFAVSNDFQSFQSKFINTEQHCNSKMSDTFFQALGLPRQVSSIPYWDGKSARRILNIRRDSR